MLHTLIGAAGKRLVIKPNQTKPGSVLVQILTADREVQASMSFDAACAAVAGEAFAMEAVSAEAVAAAEAARINDLIGAGVGS